MSKLDPTTAEVHTALSRSTALSDRRAGRHQLSRRYFLGAAAAAGGVAMLPVSFADMAAAAAPIGPGDGVLVIVNMEGGNDGLNMVVPINEPSYYDLRGAAAISAGAALPITQHRSLHPELGYVQQLFSGGQVAVIDGVGDPTNDLSHFTSAARWMTGRQGHGPQTSGWVGRYVDGLGGGADPFHAVAIGRSVPLSMQGESRQATALPVNPNGLFRPDEASDWELRIVSAIDAMGAGNTGLGALGDNLAEAGRVSLAISAQLSSTYSVALPEEDLAAEMTLAARLINANLGIRVIQIAYGDFDGHAGHSEMHGSRMAEFNAALAQFHQTLSSGFASRTTVLTISEFGRRAKANKSGGMDHGSASTLMAIGPGVVGGLYGEFPSLNDLDRRGNQKVTVDFRSVYATVLDSWLGADANQILGGAFGSLGFLGSPGAGGSGGNGGGSVPVVNQRSQLMRLYHAYFQRLPDSEGLAFWKASMVQGASLAVVSQIFAESPEFVGRYGSLSNGQFVDLVYSNVLDRSPDSTGRAHWIGQLDASLSRGDLMIAFSESDEFVQATTQMIYEYDTKGPVARLYRAYFLRDADKSGLAYWNNVEIPLQGVSNMFSDSSEFKARYGTLSNQGFVELVYQNVMKREPDGPGLAFWVERLYQGTTRGELMLNFSESEEFKARF